MKKITVFLICISLFIPQFLSNESFSIKGEDTYFNNVIYTKINNESKKEIFRNVSYDKTSWPSFKHDIYNSGCNPNAIQNNSGKLRWFHFLEGNVYTWSPIINDNTLMFGTSFSNIYFFNIHNNTLINKINNLGQISGSACVDENNNYILGTFEGLIYSLYENGSIYWFENIGEPITSSIAVNNNIISFGGEKFIYSYYINGTLKWKYYVGNFITTTPAFDNQGSIYIGSADNNLYAFYPNGTLKWKFPTKNSIIHSSPLIDKDGVIYIGSTDNKLYSIYPNGSLKWDIETNGIIYSSPSIWEDIIIFGSYDKKIYAVRTNGKIIWNFSTDGVINSSPSIDGNGNIYFGSKNGYLYHKRQILLYLPILKEMNI
jgi:hypothetical protein